MGLGNEPLTDAELVKEFQILWQNSNVRTRNKIAAIIQGYFDYGDRSALIIERLQEKIE
jgi:hypothetical protein